MEFLKKSLEGRGFYPIMVIALTWTYTAVILIFFICQLFLCIFHVKCSDDNFNKSVNEKADQGEHENE
ncbi:MAG: hypothetical protein K0R54_1030 [Clostridiaceae bacterium]|jgi:hypothetical protein|nr:hypothetical protein [Clostridiaceae bacterium]